MTSRQDIMHAPSYPEMKQMLDCLKISYWLVDLDFTLLDVNETFLEWTGASREKLVGRNMLTLVSPEEAAYFREQVKQIQHKDSAEYEFYVYGPENKEKIPVMFYMMVNRNNNGQPVSCNVVISDIRAQKSLEEKERELFHARRKIRQDALRTHMIGTGRAMETVFYAIMRCAEVDSPVLVTGETGVGKEVAAREIHAHSERRDKPFVAVNCGALPGELLETELFGHVKGAFTGATTDRLGLFREAAGGTLFLDEIGDMEKRLQVKLLRAIQENEVRPVGDDRSYKVDLRLICATNQNLRQRAETGAFRLDLFYRISVIPIYIPPLRERTEDIIKLAEYFNRKHPKHMQFSAISSEARQLLYRYHWPGNIRELQNAIEHALVMSKERILQPEALPEQIQRHERSSDTGKTVRTGATLNHRRDKHEFDKRKIINALKKHNGNQTAAAKDLGISRVTLWRKKTMYGID